MPQFSQFILGYFSKTCSSDQLFPHKTNYYYYHYNNNNLKFNITTTTIIVTDLQLYGLFLNGILMQMENFASLFHNVQRPILQSSIM